MREIGLEALIYLTGDLGTTIVHTFFRVYSRTEMSLFAF